jgi:hypothetical protein
MAGGASLDTGKQLSLVMILKFRRRTVGRSTAQETLTVVLAGRACGSGRDATSVQWSVAKLRSTQLAQLPQDFIENAPRPVLAAPTTNALQVDVCWPLHKQHIAGIVDVFRTAPMDFLNDESPGKTCGPSFGRRISPRVFVHR